MKSWYLLLVLCCLLPVALPAQPLPDDAWLTVRLLRADGTPWVLYGQVALTRLVNGAARPDGRQVWQPDRSLTVIALTPGPHQATLTFDSLGLVDGPRPIDIAPGNNVFDWTLTPFIPVSGPVTLNGTPATIRRTLAFVASQGKTGAMYIPSSPAKDNYKLAYGVFPGKYTCFLTTDAGYGYGEFTAQAEDKAVTAPISLTPGGTAEITITSAETQEPLKSITVILRKTVEKGLTPGVTIYTDAKGKATTTMLPPGEWKWSAYSQEYQMINGSITITAGAVATVAAALPKR